MSDLQQKKTKGVVDIVFLLDVTGSMQPTLDDLRDNINGFIEMLTAGVDSNTTSIVKDWRAKVIGYRDFQDDYDTAFLDNAFVSDAVQLNTQLGSMEASGGGDEPESLLDALYKVASMGATGKGDPLEPGCWRHHHDAARVVIVFTDASFHAKMTIPEAAGGTLEDLIPVIQHNKVILSVFAPEMDCYDELSVIQRSEIETFDFDASDKQGAVKALGEFTGNKDNFRATLEALAKSVTASAVAETL